MLKDEYEKIVKEGVKVCKNEVRAQTELTDKIYELLGDCSHIEFRLDLTDSDREILEPFLKETSLSFFERSREPIKYGSVEYVKASLNANAGFIDRVRSFFCPPKIHTRVQADYIMCDFRYELDYEATERYRNPENSKSEFYKKTFIDTYLNISFKSNLYSEENCQFGDVDVFSPFHFCADFHWGMNWQPECIEFPTKENARFWLWFAKKAKTIKEMEKKEYERLFEDKRKEQEKEQAELNRMIELAKSN